jgi:nucleoside-triphosphatase THEP1
MRALPKIIPTNEQLKLVSRAKSGVEIIRGAAGSGKPTTALLKLRSTVGYFLTRLKRGQMAGPVKVLVLTFNRTLAGYIKALAHDQIRVGDAVDLTVSTFAKWAMGLSKMRGFLDDGERYVVVNAHKGTLKLDLGFLVEEVDYLSGRFMPANLGDYLDARRDGRGAQPRVERVTRETILNDVVAPYNVQKLKAGRSDWNDLAVDLANNSYETYDIIIVDETQDFSANQVRAVLNQTSQTHSVVFVLDSAQRIYPRGFTWAEVGIKNPVIHRLTANFRNTVEIAQFAAAILENLELDDDGTMPDFKSASQHGPPPKVLAGSFTKQIAYAGTFIQTAVDLKRESVAFLHPLGGGWFRTVRQGLNAAGLSFVDISKSAEWPEGPENIALSTMHSAKGLEFDHVIIIGLNSEVCKHGEGVEDSRLQNLRRLLAMGASRARKTVTLGYKEEDASKLIDYLDPTTFELVRL